MHTALLTKWVETPKYVEVDTPQGLHQIAKSRAGGTHYSTKTLPRIRARGSTCEVIDVPKKDTTPFPEVLDPVQAAALLNLAVSSWMAMRIRTFNLPKNFTVLITGATTTSSTIVVPLIRSLGLDETIQLKDPVEKTDFSKLGDVNCLWGSPNVYIFNQFASKVVVQYLQVGRSMTGLEANLASANLRSKKITIRGAGPESWTFPQFVSKQEVRVVKLADIEKVWNEKGGQEWGLCHD
ncbi:uncharacterized protein K444DRAFT_645858 [Hyaloscypha bicolor E]|uniref:Uncharacterized protein n=1 Tax=Hyaloscypha bicolor E TaxID=1095630 RepID=A0A2J6SW72_9HELO|nr:uncharacterized protein K444DRAFT_645858 [Hyaloscypha bicolor E]PMD55027.1 hypothetical protein K444DRAFT_645858 [Hyaloscypha bicolor E]